MRCVIIGAHDLTHNAPGGFPRKAAVSLRWAVQLIAA